MQAPNKKVVKNVKDLKEKITAHKTLGHKIVCTIGSWDMLHIGHLRYLNAAKAKGDILVVGVDSDRGIKSYKGPLRPIIPEDERMEMLSYQDCVDYVTLTDDIDSKGRWQYEILKTLPIDVFIAVDGNSYTAEQKRTIKKYTKLEVLPRQALKTSSTDIIQNVLKNHLIDKVGSFKKR
ncbi:MAG: adenylyltransferase/cytidyltransferase family protein [Candidatus Adlerbacteria bacterium]